MTQRPHRVRLHIPTQGRLGTSRAARLGGLALAPVLVLALACAGRQSEDPAAGSDSDEPALGPLAGAPAWVTQDCRQEFEGASVICGVGSVTGVKSASLARNTAMARGRTEIARFLSIEVRSVLVDYQGQKGGEIEQEIEERSKQITDMTLSGTRLTNDYLARDGTYYALMALDLDTFTRSVQAADSLDAPLKDALITNATKAFSAREGEVSRY